LNALANLPRTLDETYERIFLGIPDDDRLFVRHVLMWISYYDDGRKVYYRSHFPCSILLHAVERSTSQISNGRQDFLYDEQALRELCGCLLVIRSQEMFYGPSLAVPTVMFAHYTVLEFLQSARIFKSPVAFFGIEKQSVVVDITRVTLMEALDAESDTLGRIQDYDSDNTVAHVVAQDFNSYCTASAMLSINSWAPHLDDRDDLATLVFEMINPSKPHFKRMCNSLNAMQTSLSVLSENGILSEGQFWNTQWVLPPVNINSAILLTPGGLKEASLLFSRIIKKVNIEVLSDEKVDLVTNLDNCTSGKFKARSYHVKGSIVDVIAQLTCYGRRFGTLFRLLLDYGERRTNPTTTLLSYIGSHVRENFFHGSCGEPCSLIRLLQLGARPDAPGYRVKPLQIAVVSWDFEGVKMH
jgi:hypothetical protein